MFAALAQGSNAALEIAASAHNIIITLPQMKSSCRHAAVLNICSEDMQTYSAALYISPRAY